MSLQKNIIQSLVHSSPFLVPNARSVRHVVASFVTSIDFLHSRPETASQQANDNQNVNYRYLGLR